MFDNKHIEIEEDLEPEKPLFIHEAEPQLVACTFDAPQPKTETTVEETSKVTETDDGFEVLTTRKTTTTTSEQQFTMSYPGK